MTNDETTMVLRFISEAWHGKPISRDFARIMGTELISYQFGDIMRVLRELHRTREWRPSLASIIKPFRPAAEQASLAFMVKTVKSWCRVFICSNAKRSEPILERMSGRSSIASMTRPSADSSATLLNFSVWLIQTLRMNLPDSHHISNYMLSLSLARLQSIPINAENFYLDLLH